MPSEIADAQIDELVKVIVLRFAPEKIILFGSRARGDARPDSDVDLLVVTPVRGSKRDLRVRIATALSRIPVATDVLVATPDELTRFRDIPGSQVYPAVHEGRALYERRRRSARRPESVGAEGRG